MTVVARVCGIVEGDAAPCGRPVPAEAALNVCARHLVVIYDGVAGAVGETDLLPAPCAWCGCRIGVHYPSGWVCAECEWRFGDAPDDVQAPPRVEVVYYVRYADRIKIGTSAGPRARIAQLPHDEVLAFERGGRELEARRHTEFAAHRIPRTEWFEEHAALTRHIDALRDGVDDPWQLYRSWVARAAAKALL